MHEAELNRILDSLPRKCVAVVGDFCVDRYLHVDPAIADHSLETGLPIHQVVEVRPFPGGSGTVLNNLHALGVGTILPVGFVGIDGEGFELRQALSQMNLSLDYLKDSASRHTGVYTKCLVRQGGGWREFNRFDIFPRDPLTEEEENHILSALDEAFERVDGIVVSDYAEKGKTGVVTGRVRDRLAMLAIRHPAKPVFADSRLHVGEFRGVRIKPNEREVCGLLGIRDASGPDLKDLAKAGRSLAKQAGRPVYVTLGSRGIMVCREDRSTHVPAYPVTGEIDIVGAGDAVLASVTGALAAGATEEDAALLGVLVSSITIQQLGTTGVARPDEVRARFREYGVRFPEVVKS